MQDINSLTIVGRLVNDVEISVTKSGTTVGKFAIAVNGYKDDEVSFLNVVIWGKLADIVNQYGGKGKQVVVQGKIKQERWEKDGQKREKVSIIADSVQLIGGKKSAAENSNQGKDDNVPF
jgi:single-strand DNA-binding protein